MAVLRSQLLLLQAVAHAEATAHRGHLAVELLPCDFVVKSQPAKLDLHTEGEEEKVRWWKNLFKYNERKGRGGKKNQS